MKGIAGDMQKAFVVLMAIAALLGWVVIEIVLWLFSFIHISFG